MANVRNIVAAAGGVVLGLGLSVALVAQADGGAAPPRTLPYSGYVDFDGTPVNANAVKLDLALFPCATPGVAAGQCQPVWVSRGTWSGGASGWPANVAVEVPVFAGRFSLELGADGQNPLPDVVFEGADTMYLALRIEGKALSNLQKFLPAAKSHVADLAHSAEHADQADQVGDLTPEDIKARRTWTKSGALAPGQSLVVATDGDATAAEVVVWEQRDGEWRLVTPDSRFSDDPTLVVYYPFDEPNGAMSVSDKSGHGRNGSVTPGNTAFGAAGVAGTAVAFGVGASPGGGVANNSLDYTPATGNLTISLWIKPTAYGNDNYLFQMHQSLGTRDFIIHHHPPGCPTPNGWLLNGLAAHMVDVCTVMPSAWNVWTHLVVVTEGSRYQQRVYVNGVEDRHDAGVMSTTAYTLQQLRIGSYDDSHVHDYIGYVDDLAIFDRPLSPGEVGELYRHTTGGRLHVSKDASGAVTLANETPFATNVRVMVVK